MTNDYRYPTTYELKEVLTSMTQRSFLNEFAQSHGVFVTNVKQEDLALEMTNLFYEESDLEKLRAEAFQRENKTSLSSFIVSSPYEDFDLAVKYDTIIENKLFERGLDLSSLRRTKDTELEIYKGEVEYNKSKAGRIQFLQNEQTNFGFSLQKLDAGVWKVEVDCTRSNDLVQMQKLFEQFVRNDDAEFETIAYKALNTKQTITFFDQLGKKALPSEWVLKTVSHILIKQDREVDKIINDDTEIDDTEKGSDIQQAMLKGTNLRTSKFVEEFVDKGYRFTAMTFEFEKTGSPQVIQVATEFKGVMRQFEVSIVYSGEKTGFDSVEPTEISITKEDKKLRSIVWSNAKVIFDEILKKKGT
jgi:hypothetical protein